MEALRQDDPRRFGPYTALTRFRETAAAVQYLAHGTDPDGLVVVTAARPELAALPAFRRRFHAEARTADRLAGGWVEPRPATSADGSEDEDLLWTASAYVPALTLAEAVDLAGPLPERAVRILGAGIAETLSRVHATGAVLQGLSPRTVLLAADGPRLTAFGPLGAAADAEARPGGQLSVRLGYLTPEQVAGQEAGPASDLFVLGLLLAYAATGSTPLADGPAEEAAERIANTEPRLDAVPDALRRLVARCLAKDPADRPTAGTVAAELALEGAAGLAKGGWLPGLLAAAVAEQRARARKAAVAASADEAEADAPARPAVPVADVPDDVQDAVPAASEDAAQAPASPTASLTPHRDTRTAQLGVIDHQAPRPDRATTQLSMPRERPALPAPPPCPRWDGRPGPSPDNGRPASATRPVRRPAGARCSRSVPRPLRPGRPPAGC
ncbi:protein kinase domain-containing protein, partial [Streptomyces sp. OR43]|uniref:protein kinase domain-containing protein n=1 Tax=Streptomyces sp. or43 TaxID=2478957 RepID=UPI0011CE1578